MQNKKIILIALCVVAAALFFFLGRSGKEENIPSGELSIAPTLQVADAATKVKLLPAELQGKVLLINIWASWCQPCKEEMPSLEALYRSMSSTEGFRMITILYKDSPEGALDYMKSQGYTFPVYIDADGVSAKKYGVTGVPETFIVDKQGKLVKKVIGGMDWNSAEVKDYLQALLKQ
ncbi:MAG: thioredoxin [Thermodesulfovibrio sp.]|nr:thioredoxin [Thermodesulfovibrio sp.]